jgi:MoaA/NifB/PqqE/SkfB family radical SAM enzyme
MGLTWGQLGDNLIEQAKEKRIPLIGQFELTARCNLQCKMCYVCQPANDKQVMARERTAKEWIKLAEEARDAGMLYLLLTGGEVFLRKDFREIYEAVSMMGFNIEIYTNATLITPEIAKWLGKIPPSRVGVTLYGASPETYESVCGHADGFEKAIRGIDLLLNEGITVFLKTTVTRRNAGDFDKLAEFAEKRGVEFGIVSYISPRREIGNTCPNEERLCPTELVAYEMHIDKYFNNKMKEKPSSGSLDDCTKQEKMIDEFPEDTESQQISKPFQCAAGSSSFWLTWDGRMTPCGLMDELSTHPLEKGFVNAWRELEGNCDSLPQCAECKQCSYKKYCMSCPARLKNETGFFDRPPQYLCDLANKEKNYRMKGVI